MVRQFGRGVLKSPSGVAMTMRDGQGGEFVRQFGRGVLKSPSGVAMTMRDGHVAVSSRKPSKVSTKEGSVSMKSPRLFAQSPSEKVFPRPFVGCPSRAANEMSPKWWAEQIDRRIDPSLTITKHSFQNGRRTCYS